MVMPNFGLLSKLLSNLVLQFPIFLATDPYCTRLPLVSEMVLRLSSLQFLPQSLTTPREVTSTLLIVGEAVF